MSDPLDKVLELVAAGRLSADEAAPILDALAARDAARGPGGAAPSSRDAARGGTATTSEGAPQFARVEVRDGGRRVVDLRIPISLGRFALDRVPGLSSDHVARVREAFASGMSGPILDVEDADGDGVRIVLE